MQASSQKTEIKIDLPKKFIFADKQRIQQCLINLLSNSVKFTQEGTISVKAWLKEPKLKHMPMVTNDYAVDQKADPDRMGRFYISVSDTGVGIPKEEQGKVFTDFGTLQSNANLNPYGVGLGLSICKKIVRCMNGDITLESSKGKGATFTFYVPFYKTPSSHRRETDQESFQGNLTNFPDLPSEFSMLVGRMNFVQKQFVTLETS